MIRKLRSKLIIITMLSLFLVLAVIMGSILLVNYHNIIVEADETLEFLAANDGAIPRDGEMFDFDNDTQDFMTTERARVSRYFWVQLTMDGELEGSDLSEIAAVDLNTVEQYLQQILDSGREKGFVEHYRYLVHTDTDDHAIRVIFLDCWRSLANLETFFIACCWVSFSGLLAVLALMILLSKWILHPFSENYEKQRQFITDAGHEIKTPLTIINADADILEMELGEGNEWLQDIQKQTARLASLTNDLIFLSRTEEAGNQIQMIEFPFSDLVDEMAQSFRSRALTEGKTFTVDICPLITLRGDEKSLRQLISVLLDNALKYSDEGGRITLTLERQGKNVLLTVFNTTAQPVDRHPERLFDRFYRGDQSHNSQTGGYGIGLSIAAAVTANHKGRIHASSADGHSLSITVTLPGARS